MQNAQKYIAKNDLQTYMKDSIAVVLVVHLYMQ